MQTETTTTTEQPRFITTLTPAFSNLLRAIHRHRKAGVTSFLIEFREGGIILVPGGKGERLGKE